MELFTLNQAVGDLGAGNVVKSFVLNTVTQKLVINYQLQKKHTISVVYQRRDLKKRIIVGEVIIAIVINVGNV
jgi:hypothetical protein